VAAAAAVAADRRGVAAAAVTFHGKASAYRAVSALAGPEEPTLRTEPPGRGALPDPPQDGREGPLEQPAQDVRKGALLEQQPEDACGGSDGKAVDVVIHRADGKVLLKRNDKLGKPGYSMQIRSVAGNWYERCPCRAVEKSLGRQGSCTNQNVKPGECPRSERLDARAGVWPQHMALEEDGWCRSKDGLVKQGIDGSLLYSLRKILKTATFTPDMAVSSGKVKKKGEWKHAGEDGTFTTTVFAFKLEGPEAQDAFANIERDRTVHWYSCQEALDKTKNEHHGEVMFAGVCPSCASLLAVVAASLLA